MKLKLKPKQAHKCKKAHFKLRQVHQLKLKQAHQFK
jgi:hypothetical protein